MNKIVKNILDKQFDMLVTQLRKQLEGKEMGLFDLDESMNKCGLKLESYTNARSSDIIRCIYVQYVSGNEIEITAKRYLDMPDGITVKKIERLQNNG